MSAEEHLSAWARHQRLPDDHPAWRGVAEIQRLRSANAELAAYAPDALVSVLINDKESLRLQLEHRQRCAQRAKNRLGMLLLVKAAALTLLAAKLNGDGLALDAWMIAALAAGTVGVAAWIDRVRA